MTTFEQLVATVDEYLLIADKGIIKLLCAGVIANRIPVLDPTWLFIVSNSSGGKSELLQAMSFAQGCYPLDDLTPKTFVSGAKSGGAETSLLYRLPPQNAILVMKDLTVLLDKDPKESSQIFSQLRLIYDGQFNKSFGTGEDIHVKKHVGLIAGTTDAIEDTNAKQASMGQRAIRYYMKQPDRHEVTRRVLKKRNNIKMREVMGKAFFEYLDQTVVVPTELPEFPADTSEDIVQLAEMATAARSSIKRKEYDRNQRIIRKDLPEMPGRFAQQLKSLGYAMMIMNNGPLTGLDNRILYQVALDSIPIGRREVMMVTTKYSVVELKRLANELDLPDESVKFDLDDLVARQIMERDTSYGNKFQYRLRESYRELISKFENIPMTNEVLEEEQTELPPVAEYETTLM